MPPEYLKDSPSSDNDSLPNAPPLSKPGPKPTTSLAANAPVVHRMRRNGQDGFQKAYNDQFNKGPGQKEDTPVTDQSPFLVTASRSPDSEDDYEPITSDVLKSSINDANATAASAATSELVGTRGGHHGNVTTDESQEQKSASPGEMARKKKMSDAQRKFLSKKLKGQSRMAIILYLSGQN